MFTVGFICYIPQQNLLRVIVLVTFRNILLFVSVMNGVWLVPKYTDICEVRFHYQKYWSFRTGRL